MPVGPRYFPDDYITDQPMRFLVAEIIREKILAVTFQEVPHSVAVLVETWEESARLLRVSATIFAERDGQKAILIGAKGANLKRVGTAARMEIEELTGKKVFLELFVKVKPKWRDTTMILNELDWRMQMMATPMVDAEDTPTDR
jgi:GTP-binding protein Era